WVLTMSRDPSASRRSVRAAGDGTPAGRRLGGAQDGRGVEAVVGEHGAGGVAARPPGHRPARVGGRAGEVQPRYRRGVRGPAGDDPAVGGEELPAVTGPAQVVGVVGG